jgi:KDO2-lipid IV(A) lauroyltransferase
LAEFIIGNTLRKKARQRGWLQTALWRLDYSLIWLLVRLFSSLDPDRSSNVGAFVGGLIGPRLQRKSAIMRLNLATAFPDKDEAELDELVKACWRNGGRVLAEYPHLPTLLNEDQDRLEIEILEPIPTYTDPSRPAVVVTAHHGNWEVVCSAMARLGIPNASLYSPPTNPYLNRMLQRSRDALLCELLPAENAARPLMRAIREGRTAGIVMDRLVHDGRDVLFFGHNKPSTILPAKLAIKFNLDLVPARVERGEGARFKVTFFPPVRPLDTIEDENDRAVEATQRIHAIFEQWIAEQPSQWLCTKRMWHKAYKRKQIRAWLAKDPARSEQHDA